MKGIIIGFLYRTVGFSMNLGIANIILKNFSNRVKTNMSDIKVCSLNDPISRAYSSIIHKLHSSYKCLGKGSLLTNPKIIKAHGLFLYLRQQRYAYTINYFMFRRKLISNF